MSPKTMCTVSDAPAELAKTAKPSLSLARRKTSCFWGIEKLLGRKIDFVGNEKARQFQRQASAEEYSFWQQTEESFRFQTVLESPVWK